MESHNSDYEQIKPLPQDLPPNMPEPKPFFKSDKERRAFYEWYQEEVAPGIREIDRKRRQEVEDFMRSPTRFCD